jgi:hypothetical protein
MIIRYRLLRCMTGLILGVTEQKGMENERIYIMKVLNFVLQEYEQQLSL